MKKTRLLLLLLGLFFNLQAIASVNALQFAMEASYAPFEYIDESGKISGFDVDIANALCQEMKVPCRFNNQAFSSLIPSLNIGKFDALISALGITQERELQVAFTQSYYEPSGSFIAAINKHYKLSDVLSKTVGVQIGSTFEKYLQDKYGSKITLKTYASIQDAFLDLTAERIDFVLADTPIANVFLKQAGNNKQYTVINQAIIDHEYFGAGYGIAVRKDNTALLQALNKALIKIKENGVYAAITKKYFG